MPNSLIIGDVHAVPAELADCEALWKLVLETVEKYKCDEVILLGDQFNTHDVVNTRVVDFWMSALKQLPKHSGVALVGNHDQLTPTIRNPHSMIPYQHFCLVVDSPIVHDNKAFMPYYHNPEEFIKEAISLKETYPDIETLICHQTFSGAELGNGFYAKDAVEPSAIPFKRILSGHIHKPMKFGKVWYVGAPRWRNLTDADVEVRNIYVWESGKSPIAIPTNGYCTRIVKVKDTKESPAVINFTQQELSKIDLRITICGTVDYISKRKEELKAKHNARCNGVVVKDLLPKASESEGVFNAFNRFSESFVPQFGTNKDTLLKEIHARF